jgi:hypothetical protein
MRTGILLTSVATISAVTAGVVTAVAAANPSQGAAGIGGTDGTGGSTITVFARHTGIASFNLPKSNGPGDQVWLSADDFNQAKGGRKVGHSFADCTGFPTGSTDSTGAENCVVTFVNPHGQIVSSGFAADTNPDVLAVLGGSGLYKDARGQVVRFGLPDGSIRFTIQLLP